MYCDWQEKNDAYVCRVCGVVRSVRVVRNCREGPQPEEHLLGDRIEKLLGRLGITQEHYMDVKKKLGMKELCKCGHRKNLLNLVSKYARQHGWIKTFKNLREIKRYLDEPR